jgi:hypothetical protein
MTTKLEAMAALKILYPTLRKGSDEDGYTDLNPTEYDAQIAEWADNKLAEKEKIAADEATKAAAQAKLAALGLTTDDLKALGL